MLLIGCIGTLKRLLHIKILTLKNRKVTFNDGTNFVKVGRHLLELYFEIYNASFIYKHTFSQ